MLVLEDLTLVWPDFRLSADLTIGERARVAILGPSGAGKSTLLATLGGFLRPQSGRILWRGRNIVDDAPADRPVATIFQDGNLFPHLSVTENVGLGLQPNGRLGREDRERVNDALSDVGLDGYGDRKPAELSGGQQSRVALARVALQDKPTLLLDEAFSALGPAMKTDMIRLVLRLCDARGLTLLMITHDPADARLFDGEVLLVADGVAHPPRPTAEIFADPPDALRAYLSG